MAGIVLPQVLVFQDFTALPSELTQPLRAFIFGPEYKLHRYTVAAEKVASGEYDPILGNTLDWLADLERMAGSIVDLDYTKVFLEDALLRYWTNSAPAQQSSEAGGYSENLDGVLISTLANIKHKIHFQDVNLVDKTGYPLDDSFYDRDVKVGDVLKVSAIIDGTEYEAEGTITALEAEDTDSTIGDLEVADANATTTGEDEETGTSVGAGLDNVSDVLPVAGGSYNGVPDGILSETYTITCVQGTVGLNPSTGVFNISTASGTDDVPGFVPDVDAYNEQMDLGTRGLTFAFDSDGDEDISVGDRFIVTVTQEWEAPTLESQGTYVGEDDTTYIITVTRGGDKTESDEDDRPQVKVTTSTGVDGASPFVLEQDAATFAVGNFGVEVALSSDELLKGDQYYITVTAAGEGAIRIAVLNRSLPTALVSTDSATVDLNAQLCVKRNQELPRELFALSSENWEQTADEITINPDALDYVSSWRDGEVALPIIGGTLFIHWRELVTEHSDKIYTIGTSGELAEEFTTQNDPDNPLVYAAYKALANSGSEISPSTGIRLMAVPTNDADGYSEVLRLAEGRDDLYTLVPLTFDTTIQQLVAAHVTGMSTPEVGQWRIAFFCQEEVNPAPVVVENTDDEVLLATTDADRFLTAIDSAFLTDEVRAGDTVRYNFSQDNYGNPTWDEVDIDQVLSEEELRLVTAPDPVIGTPSKIEIWRQMDASDVVESIGDAVTAFNAEGDFTGRRLYSVYPSTLESSGVEVPGYFMCAAIAGLIGASTPQQGLTNVELRGFDNVDGVVNRFSRSQLDTLANTGKWIVTHDLQTGIVHTRHQLSTDTTDLNTRELNVVKNVDSISYVFRNRLKPFIGRANVTPTSLEVIRTQVAAGIAFLESSGFSALTGGQVLPGTSIRELRQHALLKDRIVIIIDLVVPYPLNNVELTLVV